MNISLFLIYLFLVTPQHLKSMDDQETRNTCNFLSGFVTHLYSSSAKYIKKNFEITHLGDEGFSCNNPTARIFLDSYKEGNLRQIQYLHEHHNVVFNACICNDPTLNLALFHDHPSLILFLLDQQVPISETIYTINQECLTAFMIFKRFQKKKKAIIPKPVQNFIIDMLFDNRESKFKELAQAYSSSMAQPHGDVFFTPEEICSHLEKKVVQRLMNDLAEYRIQKTNAIPNNLIQRVFLEYK